VDKQVVINLKLYNRQYKIKVQAEEEAFVRKQAEEINNYITDFQQKYRGRDIQDYLALTMIARITATKPNEHQDVSAIIDELNKISNLIG